MALAGTLACVAVSPLPRLEALSHFKRGLTPTPNFIPPLRGWLCDNSGLVASNEFRVQLRSHGSELELPV